MSDKEQDYDLIEKLKDPVYVEQFITASLLLILDGDGENS